MGSIGNMLPASEDERSSRGVATVLGIGTAVPPFIVEQSSFPDYYFKITNSEHKVQLKEKFVKLCEVSMIEKRHMCLTEEMLQENPQMAAYQAPSLDARQVIMDIQVPKLGAEAANKAIKDWGRPKSDITHLVFCNSGGASLPGADFELVKLLSLPLTTRRFMLYHQGCFGGGTALRLAKDIAENNSDARVLVVCSEIASACSFRGPCEEHFGNLICQALFGDGAAAVVVGANLQVDNERMLFQIVHASQRIVPGSDGAVVGKMREVGYMIDLHPDVPKHISASIENIVEEALAPLGISEWNDVFWVVHPGGKAVLDEVEVALQLRKNKLKASRQVLKEYGNTWSSCVLFVMETMRRRSEKEGLTTAGEGLEWGVLCGFGPGLTAETLVLRCPST